LDVPFLGTILTCTDNRHNVKIYQLREISEPTKVA